MVVKRNRRLKAAEAAQFAIQLLKVIRSTLADPDQSPDREWFRFTTRILIAAVETGSLEPILEADPAFRACIAHQMQAFIHVCAANPTAVIASIPHDANDRRVLAEVLIAMLPQETRRSPLLRRPSD